MGVHLYEFFEGLCVLFRAQHAHGLLESSNSWKYELLCAHDIFWIAHLQHKLAVKENAAPKRAGSSPEILVTWEPPLNAHLFEGVSKLQDRISDASDIASSII